MDDNATQETAEVISTETPQVFGTVQKRDDTLLMISLNNYKGHQYMELRDWWLPKGEETYLPTKKGVTIPIADSLESLTTVIEALIEARRQLEKQDNKETIN